MALETDGFLEIISVQFSKQMYRGTESIFKYVEAVYISYCVLMLCLFFGLHFSSSLLHLSLYCSRLTVVHGLKLFYHMYSSLFTIANYPFSKV